MWRVATATLAVPPALASGPSGAFWNPAPQVAPPRLALGAQVVQTPDVIGMSGALLGVAQRLGQHIVIGGMLGQVAIQDIARTTTSPLTVLGDIPVSGQLGGLGLGFSAGPVAAGVAARAHRSRFDTETDDGVTVDFGIRFRPFSRLTLAGATHLLPAGLGRRSFTEYFGAAEYLITAAPVFGARARVVGRYGATYHDGYGLDHGVGVGLTLDEAFSVDAMWTSEEAYGLREGRLALGVGLRVGRYAIAVSRGAGLNELGATYRIGLDIELFK